MDLDRGGMVELADMDQAAELVEERMIRRAEYVRVACRHLDSLSETLQGFFPVMILFPHSLAPCIQVRRKWLIFDSLLKVHQRAVLKASYELFTADFGHDAAHRLWKYLETIQVVQDDLVFSEGTSDNTLYMLHAGRATAFTSGDGNEYKRLHTITKGWFNTECLIENLPCAYSVVADQDCDLVILTEASLRQMELDEPDLLVIIQRTILRVEALLRQRLKREVTAVDLADAHNQSDVWPHRHIPSHKYMSKELRVHHHLSQQGTHVSAKRNDSLLSQHSGHRHSVMSTTIHGLEQGWLMNDPHHLHFSFFHAHFHQGVVQEDPRFDVPSWLPSSWHPREDTTALPLAAQVEPQLSAKMQHEAEESFLQHSSAASEFEILLRRAEREFFQPLASLKPRRRPLQPGGEPTRNVADAIQRLVNGAELATGSLHNALKDLGLYPTDMELEECRKYVATQRARGRRGDTLQPQEFHGNCHSAEMGTIHEENVLDCRSFLMIVKHLTLDHTNATERAALHDTFVQHSDVATNLLSHTGLRVLMSGIGHPMETAEVDAILDEWQQLPCQEGAVGFEAPRGLTFSAFLSMMSVFLKRESVAEEMELDFLRFAGVLEASEAVVADGTRCHPASIGSSGSMHVADRISPSPSRPAKRSGDAAGDVPSDKYRSRAGTVQLDLVDKLCQTLASSPEDLEITALGVMEVYQRHGLDIDLTVAQDMVFDAGQVRSETSWHNLLSGLPDLLLVALST